MRSGSEVGGSHGLGLGLGFLVMAACQGGREAATPSPAAPSPVASSSAASISASGGTLGGTLLGPIVGAALVNGAKSVFTQVLPEYWLYVLGLMFILVTLFMPQGVVGLLARRKAAT